jgi:hypothetical protein
MRGLILIIAGLLLLASPGICQVDTLQLVEIGSIEAPAQITDLYVEDLDGDSLKEIVLTTAGNVHIYNGITYEEIWTSPELVNPQDLLFEDINLDGFIDFSVKDTTNIRLFDPHNDATIWTSPEIDSTYSCYTIGHRNDDDWVDVAIVSKEPFTREDDPENMDTVWVGLFDGPGYSDEESFVILMENVNYGDPFSWRSVSQIPTKIVICRLSSYGLLENRIVLYSDINDNSGGHQPNYSGHRDTGNLWLIDSDDFSSILIEDIGRLSKYSIATISHRTYLYSLNFVYGFFQHDIPAYSIRRDINIVSADSLIASVALLQAGSEGHYPTDWRGFLMEDIIREYRGDELCYLFGDSMTFYSVRFDIVFWRTGGMPNSLYVRHYYSSAVVNSEPSIMCRDYSSGDYMIFNAADGSLSGVLLASEDLEFRSTVDIDNNGDYELITIEGDIARIFLAELLIGLEEESPNLPQSVWFINYPNPFNSSTTIEYGLPEAGHVTIEIYDLLGRRVETLIDGEQYAGTYQVVWDAGDRSSGVYFYKITSGESAETKRIVLLK